MKNKPDTSAATVKLRRLAEMKLIDRKKKTGPLPAMETDIRRMVHELEVHQIELEMQNEELVRARTETEAALQQFTELYDFAPVGYFTLTRDGAIQQVNLAGASLVGVERSKLLNTRLGAFLSTLSQLTFKTSLDRVFTSGKKETCEVTLIKAGADPFCVQIEATLFEAQNGQDPLCNAIIMDIDTRVQA